MASVDECSVVRCVAAHSVMCRGAVLCSVMWQHSLVPRPSVFCLLQLSTTACMGARLVPALQERHDVTCHWYRYLSHQADVTCRLLYLYRHLQHFRVCGVMSVHSWTLQCLSKQSITLVRWCTSERAWSHWWPGGLERCEFTK